jgi:putative flippase GtrA
MLATLNRLLIINKKSFFIYMLTGGMTAVLYLGLFSFFWRWMGMSYLLGVTLAYSIAVLFHFSVNRRYTFQRHGSNLTGHVKKYSVLLIINLIITLLVVNFSVKVLLLSPFIGAVFSIAVSMLVGYILARYWVFK